MNMEGETICGFYVSAEQKRVNAVFLDLIQEFGRLCENAGLTWWLIFGGLIGAVRHKGFIPWDDDIDLLMPRADFEKLRKMTNEEFGAKEPYFLQNYKTEPACVNALIRFRRSDTADIRPGHITEFREHPEHPIYNMGISLAVFPLDAVPASPLAFRMQKSTVYLLWGIFYRATTPDPKKPFQHRVCRVIYDLIGGQNLMRLTHWLYQHPRRVRDDMLQSYDGLYGNYTQSWPKRVFDRTEYLPFEDITVPVPAGWDEFLRITYGDYMQLPPEDKRTSPHGGITTADRSYKEVLQELL